MTICIYIYKANGSYQKQEFIEKSKERMGGSFASSNRDLQESDNNKVSV